jgi:hypothetical protein
MRVRDIILYLTVSTICPLDLVSKPHVLVGPNEQQIAKSDNWQQYFPNFIISVKILAPPFTYINC